MSCVLSFTFVSRIHSRRPSKTYNIQSPVVQLLSIIHSKPTLPFRKWSYFDNLSSSLSLLLSMLSCLKMLGRVLLSTRSWSPWEPYNWRAELINHVYAPDFEKFLLNKTISLWTWLDFEPCPYTPHNWKCCSLKRLTSKSFRYTQDNQNNSKRVSWNSNTFVLDSKNKER